jgi:hypothetical protein
VKFGLCILLQLLRTSVSPSLPCCLLLHYWGDWRKGWGDWRKGWGELVIGINPSGAIQWSFWRRTQLNLGRNFAANSTNVLCWWKSGLFAHDWVPFHCLELMLDSHQPWKVMELIFVFCTQYFVEQLLLLHTNSTHINLYIFLYKWGVYYRSPGAGSAHLCRIII